MDLKGNMTGFTKGRSHLNILTARYSERTVFQDEERAVGAMYLEFSKAFKTLPYYILGYPCIHVRLLLHTGQLDK